MKISRIKVDRYGPLQNLDLQLNPNFNVIYGSNESGKSLTMDFLLKKFSRKKIAKHKRIDRVDEKPEGYIIFTNGEEKKLEANQYLTDILQEVEDEDICCIFVMKDSDLNIPDSDYYSSITDRLTGLRTKDIVKISDEILNFGCLTGTTQTLANNRESNYLKNKFDSAKELREKIVQYIKIIENNDINELEGELFSNRIVLKKYREDLGKQEAAKRKKEFDENKTSIEAIERSQQILKDSQNEDLLKTLKVNFNDYKKDASKLRNYSLITNFSKLGLIPSFLVTLLFWLVWIFTKQPIFGIFTPVITSFFLIVFISFWFYAFNKMKAQREFGNELIEKAISLGYKDNTLDNLEQFLDSQLDLIKKNNDTITSNISVLNRSLDIAGNSTNIIELASKELEKLKEKIDPNIKTKYNYSKEEELKGNIGKLEEEITSKERELNTHQEKLSNFSRDFHNINIDSIIDGNFDVEIESIASLSVTLKHLDDFIQYIENRTTNCKNALKIIEAMSKDEDAKITRLFDKDSVCSEFFSEITNGKYIDIIFDSALGEIKVKKANGDYLLANKLSEGAFDQLYLAIRVDFAQRILQGESGFLIMDDIFLSYDTARLKEGLKILQKLVDKNWQIIYFTAKDQVCELFTNLTGNEIINLPNSFG